MYCVDCGQEKSIFREGSCLECYLKNHQFTKGPGVFHIPVCNYCGGYKYKNTWKNESFETVIKRYVKSAFSFSPDLKNIQIGLDCHNEEDSIFCKVAIIGLIDDVNITEDHFVEIRLKPNVCDVCSKQFGGYHEAIVQIRPWQRKLTEKKKVDIQFFTENLIRSLKDQGNRQVFLTDMGREHGGLDFFISDKQAAYTIIKRVQERFGGDIHVSSKNVGMKDGKQVYRYTYLLRLLPFERDDVFKLHDEYFIVLNVHGTQLHIMKLQDHSDSFVKSSDVSQGIFIDTAEKLSFTPILVNKTKTELQLMHPKSYSIFIIKKPSEHIMFSDDITILQINEHYFIKPGSA